MLYNIFVKIAYRIIGSLCVNGSVAVRSGGVVSVDFYRKYKSGIEALAAIAALCFAMFLLDIPCPIKWFTGVSCPGCGMTRAWLRVLHFDFHGAWGFHPLFWIVPVAAAAALFLRKRFPAAWKGFVSVVVALFIVVYLFRMFDETCSIVVFEPRNSLVYRVVQYLT